MAGFLDRLGRGWALTKTSLRIIREEKQLLLLPVISGITLALVIMSFVAGFFGLVVSASLFSAMDGTAATILLIILGFLFYVVTYFVGIYFNAALIHCATIKLQGGKPTLGEGFRAANQALGKLFAWAAVAATVGMIISAIQSRGGIIGKVVGTIAGIAWSIAIYFAVPVILYERLSPFPAVRRSVEIMRKTWGEALGGTFGMGIIFGLLALAGMIPLMLGIVLAVNTSNIWILVAFVIITIIYWIALAIFYSAAQGVLLAALYRYAVTGAVSPGFAAAVYSNPWSQAATWQAPPPYRPSY
jgi:hypothetical protein